MNKWTTTCRKQKQKQKNPFFTPFPKINSKGITDLNGKYKTTKLLEGNKGGDPNGLGFGDDLSDTTPRA